MLRRKFPLISIHIIFMKNFTHSINLTKDSESIWNLWTDVPNWKNWDTAIKESSLDWEFSVGTYGTIVPEKWPKIQFQIVEIEKWVSFANISKLPLCTLYFFHTYDGTTLTHGIEFRWFLAPLFAKLLWSTISGDIVHALENIKNS